MRLTACFLGVLAVVVAGFALAVGDSFGLDTEPLDADGAYIEREYLAGLSGAGVGLLVLSAILVLLAALATRAVSERILVSLTVVVALGAVSTGGFGAMLLAAYVADRASLGVGESEPDQYQALDADRDHVEPPLEHRCASGNVRVNRSARGFYEDGGAPVLPVEAGEPCSSAGSPASWQEVEVGAFECLPE